MNFGTISPYHVAAGVAVFGTVAFVSIFGIDRAVKIGTLSSFCVCSLSSIFLLANIINNTVACIFARFGKLEAAEWILNNTPPKIFIREHVGAITLIASITFALTIIGVTYSNE